MHLKPHKVDCESSIPVYKCEFRHYYYMLRCNNRHTYSRPPSANRVDLKVSCLSQCGMEPQTPMTRSGQRLRKHCRIAALVFGLLRRPADTQQYES